MSDLQIEASASPAPAFLDEHRAYLTFIGDFEPDDISSAIGIAPTRTFVKGEPRPRTGLKYEFSRWSLESRLPRLEPGSKHVKNVLEQVRPARRVVKELRKKYEGWLQLVGWFGCQGGFNIDARDVAELAEMNLGIDFDLYMVGIEKE